MNVTMWVDKRRGRTIRGHWENEFLAGDDGGTMFAMDVVVFLKELNDFGKAVISGRNFKEKLLGWIVDWKHFDYPKGEEGRVVGIKAVILVIFVEKIVWELMEIVEDETFSFLHQVD